MIRRFLTASFTLLGIPLAAIAAYMLWSARHTGERGELLLEPGDAIELDVDGRVPFRYDYMGKRENWPP